MLNGRIGHGVAHDVAAVVDDIALLSQGVKLDGGVLVQTHRQRQRLDHGLVMAGLAGQGAKPVGLQGGVGRLHDGLVSHIKTPLGAQAGQLGVVKAAFCCLKQSVDVVWIGRYLFKLPDLHQVFQAHSRPLLQTVSAWP